MKTPRGYFDKPGEGLPQQRYSETWLLHMKTISSSQMLKAISRILVAQFVLACVAALVFMVRPWTLWEMPHSLVSVSLGLLLVHRTGHSYDRYWLGRCAWQRLVDACRNVTRRAVVWTSGDPDDDEENNASAQSSAAAEAGRDIAAHGLAVVAACEARLKYRTQNKFRALLAPLVPQKFLDRIDAGLLAAANPVVLCATQTGRLIARAARNGHISDLCAIELDTGVADMVRAAGEARRTAVDT